MANPNVEDGHTRISNELFEAIIAREWTKTQYAVLFFVIRKTYGWKKKSDKIGISQFQRALPYSKASICNAIKQLKTVHVLIQFSVGGGRKVASEWGLNKNYEEWKTVQIQKLSKYAPINCPNSENKQSTYVDTQKKLIQKKLTKERGDFLKKKKIQIMQDDPDVVDVQFDPTTSEPIKIY